MLVERSSLMLYTLTIIALGLAACAPQAPPPEELWATSAHADAEAAAFSRWNNEEPPEIPTSCAKCHSTIGYRDFLGLDGATAGQVDNPVPVGTTVECDACHNEAAASKHAVLMPSGKTIDGLGLENSCMECHQGRASGVDIREATGSSPLDSVDPELSFTNIHNAAAGPTQYGTLAMGGYEYTGKSYAERYDHTPEFSTCIECHDAHALRVKVDSCSACHLGVTSEADLVDIRTTNIDFDGDQDVQEGIAAEIEGLRQILIARMNLYAAQTEGVEMLQYVDGRPYFTDREGEEYETWTPRLLRAAFNYHYTAKEPGGYAHNPHYQLQLLYDSLQDLGGDTRFINRADP